MKIELTTPIEVVLRPVQKKTVSSLTVLFYTDSVQDKKLTVQLAEIPTPIILWEKDAYDAIGQWTDDQAKARLIEVLSHPAV